MLPGETILSGASTKCQECGVVVTPQICRSNAGWYIGTMCNCGPYTRESHYYKSYAEAEKAFKSDTVKWRTE